MYYGLNRMYRNHGMQCCRQFQKKEEKIKYLEEHKNWLEKEKKGVEEAIEELKKAS